MTTVIYIHGIGGRLHNFLTTFEEVKSRLTEHPLLLQRDINVVPCLWGERYGARSRLDLSSTPSYEQTGGMGNTNDDILLWEQLYRDPYYELRFFALRQPRQRMARFSREVTNQVNNLRNNIYQDENFLNCLLLAGIQQDCIQAYQTLLSLTLYDNLLRNVSEPLEEYYQVIARAIIAKSIHLSRYRFVSIQYNFELRDNLVNQIFRALMGNRPDLEDLELRGFMSDFIRDTAILGLNSFYLDGNRGSLTDLISPYVGDVLVYQANGSRIRQYIKSLIEEADSPVVLLGHSLGGVACVDLLIEDFDDILAKVKLLITVGSQASFFYEFGALQSLLPGEDGLLPSVPNHFMREGECQWLNIYDPKDVLSFIAEPIFVGRVTDFPIHNNQPFPTAHSAYWFNQSMWGRIAEVLP